MSDEITDTEIARLSSSAGLDYCRVDERFATHYHEMRAAVDRLIVTLLTMRSHRDEDRIAIAQHLGCYPGRAAIIEAIDEIKDALCDGSRCDASLDIHSTDCLYEIRVNNR